MLQLDEKPQKRMQTLLRSQLGLEHLIKLTRAAWDFFGGEADRVKACA